MEKEVREVFAVEALAKFDVNSGTAIFDLLI